MDSKTYQVSSFCDLCNAFDTISHEILLHKLSVLGIRDPAYKLLEQKTIHKIEKCKIIIPICEIWCPSRVNIRLDFFLIYINDIERVSNNLQFILYADDITIIYQSRGLSELLNIINTE